jgi:hypothetical protein
MQNHKAQLAEGAIFWILYIMMTGIVIFMIASIPTTIYSQTTETYGMENAILNERIYSKVSWQSDLTNRQYPGELQSLTGWKPDSIKNAFDTLGAPRQLGFRVAIDGQEAYYDRDFYNRAKPLSPVRYKGFEEKRPVWIVDEKKIASLTLEQLFSPKPKGGLI